MPRVLVLCLTFGAACLSNSQGPLVPEAHRAEIEMVEESVQTPNRLPSQAIPRRAGCSRMFCQHECSKLIAHKSLSALPSTKEQACVTDCERLSGCGTGTWTPSNLDRVEKQVEEAIGGNGVHDAF